MLFLIFLTQTNSCMHTLAYAGFSKRGRGAENLRIMKIKRKHSPVRFSPIFDQKLSEDQKKGLHSDLVRF